MHKCVVCDHAHREELEAALLKISPENADECTEKIAKAYDVPVPDLHEHMLFHTPFSCDPGSDSIVRQIKMKEADILASATMDQLHTMKAVGKRIRKFVDDEDVSFERTLTKPVVDLYTGSGDILRKNVQTLADINQLLNGPKDEGISGLAALAKVLDESRRGITPVEEDAE